MAQATFRIWRGDPTGGQFHDYQAETGEGMVVLDAVHQIQATQAPDLACRWNCKAGKCGSCSAEINGVPRLMCMTRVTDLPLELPVIIEPMQAFPLVKDLVTDVSANYRVKQKIAKFKPRPPDEADGTWRMAQEDVDRVQEFRKCIECFLCQDVCHVLRDHHKHEEFVGPRFLVYVAALEMHPLDTGDRVADLKEQHGVSLCNITKCCTTVCPEHIKITDNAIIPLKERVVDDFFDPVQKLIQLVWPRKKQSVEVVVFTLKALSPEAVPAALEKALRYRLLNEPEQAASICEDVLQVDPNNQEALAMLILALTDNFGSHRPTLPALARELLPRLEGKYEREYYAGIIWEREAIAWLRADVPCSGATAFDCFRQAMACFERAEEVRPPANDDAALRWNSCARMLMRHPDIAPEESAEEVGANLGE